MAASIQPVRSLLHVSNFTKQLSPYNRIPCLNQIRERHKVNIKHPWPGHINRQVLVKVTEPIIVEPYMDPATACTRRKSLGSFHDEISEYEHFLIRHQKKLHAENSDGILAFFCLSSVLSKVYHKGKVVLRREGFDIYQLNSKVFHHTVKGTKYETLNTVVNFNTALVMCPEPRVKEMMSAASKLSYMHLLCAVVEGQLLSKSQMETYAKYPDKLTMIAQTCSVLNQCSQRTSHLLTGQQEQLVRNLDSYVQKDS